MLRSSLRLFSPLLLGFALLLPGTAPVVAATPGLTFSADYSSAELVRLINGERVFHGLPTLSVDELLSSKARDGALACPGDPSLVMSGRAKDMALNEVFSHNLRLCPKNTVLDLFNSWGYNTYRGEIIAWNNYPVANTTYYYGCSLAGTDCSSTKRTTTSGTVAASMIGYMKSSGHRTIILGKYDRVGCGSWFDPVSGKNTSACLFSLGGPEHRDLVPPTVASLSGNARIISSPAAFTAALHDAWRLSSGRVTLDGTVIAFWPFNLNVSTYRASVRIDPSSLAVGRHTLTWRATDGANRTSSATGASVTFTVARP